MCHVHYSFHLQSVINIPCYPQAIEAIAVARDGKALWASRLSAYTTLEPLVWRQVLAQSEQLWNFFQYADSLGAGMLTATAAETRADETLNGWLEVRARTTASGDYQDGESATWTRKFCALTDGLFTIFDTDQSTLPEDLICLQFATISANGETSHAFNITTPVQSIELRAIDDHGVEKWTEAIFALHCSDTFNQLVPVAIVCCYPAAHGHA